MTVEMVLKLDNFQEQDARTAERKGLSMVLKTIGGVPIERLEIV